MIIAVRSEIDSRPLVYPMIRVLKNYGSVCFITSNRQCNRLIDGDGENGFRNITVIVEESGALDEVYEDNSITKDSYDFIILDNMGLMEYDILFVPVGEVSSAAFQEEIELLKTDSKVRFVQFGDVKKSKHETKRQKSSSNKLSSEEKEYSPEKKFSLEQTIDEEYNVAERYHNVSYPVWQDIENFESLHAFMKPEKGLADVLYTEFKNVIGLDKRTYDKEISKEDLVEKGNLDLVMTDIDKGAKSNNIMSSRKTKRR